MHDKIAEECADCFAMLDQMDAIFGTVDFVDNPESTFNNFEQIVSDIGQIQMWLAGYSGRSHEKILLRKLFYHFRRGLKVLSKKIGIEKVEAWQKKKHDRIVEMLTR